MRNKICTLLGLKKAIIQLRLITSVHMYLTVLCRQSAHEGDDDSSDYWTLGESIIRTLSRRDMLSLDFENPQYKR